MSCKNQCVVVWLEADHGTIVYISDDIVIVLHLLTFNEGTVLYKIMQKSTYVISCAVSFIIYVVEACHGTIVYILEV